jgi:hypothetical protein
LMNEPFPWTRGIYRGEQDYDLPWSRRIKKRLDLYGALCVELKEKGMRVEDLWGYRKGLKHHYLQGSIPAAHGCVLIMQGPLRGQMWKHEDQMQYSLDPQTNKDTGKVCDFFDSMNVRLASRWL